MTGKACRLRRNVRRNQLQCQWEAEHAADGTSAAPASPAAVPAGRTAPSMNSRARRQLQRSHLQCNRGNDSAEAMTRTTTEASTASAEDASAEVMTRTTTGASAASAEGAPAAVLRPEEETGEGPCVSDLGAPRKSCRQRRAERRAHLQWSRSRPEEADAPSVVFTAAPAFELPTASRLVVRNTFLSFDEPKENEIRIRASSEPFELGSMCSEDSADDESQCSTDMCSMPTISDHVCEDIDFMESNEAQVVVRNTFLDVRMPREQRRRKSVPFEFSCMYAEDTADNESQCSTDICSMSSVSDHQVCEDIDGMECNEAQVVVRNTFLDVCVPREQRRRKSVH